MSQNGLDLAVCFIGLAACGLVVAGLWMAWPPIAVVAAGLVMLKCAQVLHGKRGE